MTSTDGTVSAGVSPVQQMAAACSGALITSLIVTPLDVVKIRLQAQQKTSTKCFVYCNGLMDHLCPCVPEPATPSSGVRCPPMWYHRPGKFTGTLDAFVKITKSEGLMSLWSGLSPTLVLAVPSTIIYFVTYEQLKTRLANSYVTKNADGSTTLPSWIPLVSGATARTWAATIISPMELVRTKMQSQRLSYLEVGAALKSLLNYHGITGLWKGYGSTLLRDVPFSALYWVNYEHFKAQLRSNTDMSPILVSFISGAIAGGLSAFVTTPFDVAKTHQQIAIGEGDILSGKTLNEATFLRKLLRLVLFCPLIQYDKEPPSKRRVGTTFTILAQVYRQHGIAGMFAGLTPRLVKVAPACAIMIASFEYGKSFFAEHNARVRDSH